MKQNINEGRCYFLPFVDVIIQKKIWIRSVLGITRGEGGPESITKKVTE